MISLFKMPAMVYEKPHHHLATLGRSILSLRRSNAVAAVDYRQEQHLHHLHLFNKHVALRLLRVASLQNPETLTLPSLQILLRDFLSSLRHFKSLLLLTPPPADHRRAISDLLDSAAKSLDICNAVADGLDSISNWQKRAQIASSALKQRRLGEARLRRAKRALTSLIQSMDEEKSRSNRTTARKWSFGRKSVSPSRLSSKQSQAMSATNLHPPRGPELNSAASAIYTLSSLLVFLMRVLAAAILRPDGGFPAVHFPAPARKLPWVGPMAKLQEKIAATWKNDAKMGGGGLRELKRLEKCSHGLLELGPENEEQVKALGFELEETCRELEEGLAPLQRLVREVFHEITRSRMEVLDLMAA